MAKVFRRAITGVCAIVFVALVLSIYSHPRWTVSSSGLHGWIHVDHQDRSTATKQIEITEKLLHTNSHVHPTPKISTTHVEIFSQTRKDGRYLRLNFGDYQAINPNIIPHPQLEDIWIIVAQKQRSNVQNTVWFAELACNAVFRDDILVCIESPLILPIAATSSPLCSGDFDHFNWNVGPHDARVFYGPHNPYAIWGSNSKFACFGQWVQDFRLLVDWGREEGSPQPFTQPTDLQRPLPYGLMEKNWFLFWDAAGQMYLHYDIFPRRVFAQVDRDGAVAENLALHVEQKDGICTDKYLPALAPTQESIHQATNSLSITLCKRSDANCAPSISNTFIMTIVQHKAFYSLHSVYEPYVVLFRASAPFELYAISSKPFWIHGRGVSGEKRPSKVPAHVEWTQSEMFYVTSISWKTHGQRYHGHLDDTLLISFGIEDESSGMIDVPASDLLESLGMC